MTTADRPKTYVEQASELLAKFSPDPLEPALADLYTLLALTKGEATTLADVHDAWAMWRMRTRPDHPDLVPFAELAAGIADWDKPYLIAIHSTAHALALVAAPVESESDKGELVWICARVEEMRETEVYESIPRARWEQMSEARQSEYLSSAAIDAMNNAGGCGAQVVDESDVPEDER